MTKLDVLSDPTQEAAREAECPNRGSMSCALVNAEVGRRVVLALPNTCDACWDLGYQTQEAAALRDEFIAEATRYAKQEEASNDEEERIVTQHLSVIQSAGSFIQAITGGTLSTYDQTENSYIQNRWQHCSGQNSSGVEVQDPCPYFKDSEKYPGAHYCQACGCGDRRIALLDAGRTPKLTRLKVRCPRKLTYFWDEVAGEIRLA